MHPSAAERLVCGRFLGVFHGAATCVYTRASRHGCVPVCGVRPLRREGTLLRQLLYTSHRLATHRWYTAQFRNCFWFYFGSLESCDSTSCVTDPPLCLYLPQTLNRISVMNYAARSWAQRIFFQKWHVRVSLPSIHTTHTHTHINMIYISCGLHIVNERTPRRGRTASHALSLLSSSAKRARSQPAHTPDRHEVPRAPASLACRSVAISTIG